MPTSRKQDDNGFLLVKGCPITSFGIFDYSAGQVGLPGDPNRIVKVFRPESAVNDPDAIASFRDLPLINDHEMLSGFQGDKNATAPEDYGVSGTLTGNVYYEAPWMRGDLKVFSRSMQAALASGKKDLSLGYGCDFTAKPGIWQGQHYEVVQTNMRGNHIALVDEGRVPGARVLDGLIFDHLNFEVVPSKPTEDYMKLKGKAFDDALQTLKAILPELQTILGSAEGGDPDGGAATGTEGAAASGVSNAAGEDKPGSVSAEVPEGGAVTVEHGGDPAAASGEGSGSADPATGDPKEGGNPSASNDPTSGEGSGAGSGDINGLITEVESVLAKLKAAMSGSQAGDDNGDPAAAGTDAVEGLQEGGEKGAAAGLDADTSGAGAGVGEGQGKTSPGPTAGVHSEASDAALQRFYADLSLKTSLYDRVSKVVGAFDCKAMDARGVAAYGVKKFGLKATPETATVVLDAYLMGIETAKKPVQVQKQKVTAQDEAVKSDMDKYLQGAK